MMQIMHTVPWTVKFKDRRLRGIMISIKPTKFNTLTKYFNFGQLERPKIKKKRNNHCWPKQSSWNLWLWCNTKSARLLYELYRFQCPAHTCDRSLKRLARSKPMSVVEIKERYESLPLFAKIFRYNTKTKKGWSKQWKCCKWCPFICPYMWNRFLPLLGHFCDLAMTYWYLYTT